MRHVCRASTAIAIAALAVGSAGCVFGTRPQTPATVPADQPVARRDRNSQMAHEQLLAKAKRGGIDVYFEGDSIVRRWGATDYPDLLANWRANFFGWNSADLRWGAETTRNILWGLQHGVLEGVQPEGSGLVPRPYNPAPSGPTDGS